MKTDVKSSEDGITTGGKVSLWKWSLAVLAILLVAFGLYQHRYAVNRLADQAIAGETGAQTVVHRRDWIGGNDLVFDIRSVDGEMSMADMTRRFLKTAEALKDTEFDKVYLAYQGNEKFYLQGSYFKQLGEEREFQNPVYTIRTLPEHVYALDGTPAFGTWTGGWLGVMGKQLDDSNEFHKQWWVNEALGDFQQ
jgi:hypothetical protein